MKIDVQYHIYSGRNRDERTRKLFENRTRTKIILNHENENRTRTKKYACSLIPDGKGALQAKVFRIGSCSTMDKGQGALLDNFRMQLGSVCNHYRDNRHQHTINVSKMYFMSSTL